MRVRLRKLGTGSVFLLALVIYGAAGLLVGGLIALAASVPLPEGYEVTVLDRLGPWALAVFPAVYGLAGGLFAALAAVLYNLAAAVTGGITVELSGLEGLDGPGGESAGGGPRTEAFGGAPRSSQPEEAAVSADGADAGAASSSPPDAEPSSSSSGE